MGIIYTPKYGGSSHSMKVRKQGLTNYDCAGMMNDVNIVK